MFLAPASACHPIRNDRKAFFFRSIRYLGFVLELNLLPSSKTQSISRKLNPFLDFRQMFHLMPSCNGHVQVWYSKFIGLSEQGVQIFIGK
jgi:hypothetical protein